MSVRCVRRPYVQCVSLRASVCVLERKAIVYITTTLLDRIVRKCSCFSDPLSVNNKLQKMYCKLLHPVLPHSRFFYHMFYNMFFVRLPSVFLSMFTSWYNDRALSHGLTVSVFSYIFNNFSSFTHLSAYSVTTFSVKDFFQDCILKANMNFVTKPTFWIHSAPPHTQLLPKYYLITNLYTHKI